MNKLTAVSFLFGAGVSQAAGYPSTDDLTQKVLSGINAVRHTDETYYFRSIAEAQVAPVDNYVGLITQFLAEIKTHIESYFACFSGSCGRSANYEDFCYVADQIYGSESGEWDNPAIKPLVEKLGPAVARILGAEHGTSVASILDFASESQNYIADLVWRSLLSSPQATHHLGWVIEALADKDVCIKGIGTLNHDLHLERHLRAKGINLNDGFEDSEESIRYWQPECLLNQPGVLPYLKLHGSVDWFRFRPNGTTWWEEKIGIPPSDDYWHTRDVNGQLLTPVDGRPLLLVGTLNKITEYSAGVFGDLHFTFRQMLRTTKKLLVAGYSFGDKGINTAILEWLYCEKNRSIIYIHPDPIAARNRARGAIRNKWEMWLKDRVMRVVEARVESVLWVDLKNHLA